MKELLTKKGSQMTPLDGAQGWSQTSTSWGQLIIINKIIFNKL